MLHRIKSFLLIALLALLPACKQAKSKLVHKTRSSKKYIKRAIVLPKMSRYQKRLAKNKAVRPKLDQEQPYVTVWVHGTTNNPVFKYFHSGPIGLHAAKDLSRWYRMRKLAYQISERAAEQYPFEHFYIFSWSGDLSFKAREQAAAELHEALIGLTTQYQEKYKRKPNIRMITHSHGGNVALNLVRITQTQPAYAINELILLACPVQQSTCDLVRNPLFERVYSLYSFVDMMQVLDPQGMYPEEETRVNEEKGKKLLFSRREFPACPKLRQAAIRLHGRALSHVEFIFTPFIWAIPLIIADLDSLANDNEGRVVINIKHW